MGSSGYLAFRVFDSEDIPPRRNLLVLMGVSCEDSYHVTAQHSSPSSFRRRVVSLQIN